MIDDSDQSPAWLRDYKYTDFSEIAADIDGMTTAAQQLLTDVQKNYIPHRDQVSTGMMTQLPDVPGEFVELSSFLLVHNGAQNSTLKNVFNYGKGSNRYATAAKEIGAEYQGSDAYSRAKVSDVDSRLGAFSPAPTDSTTGSTSDSTSYSTGAGDL